MQKSIYRKHAWPIIDAGLLFQCANARKKMV